jgi:hypothetical protein
MTYSYRDDPVLGSVLAFWVRKRGARSMPSKRDMDPMEIPPALLPNLQIIDVLDGGKSFRYRLVGTALVRAYGEDYTGKYSDKLLDPELRRAMHEMYEVVYKSKAPLFAHHKYKTSKDIDPVTDRIYMPLSDDGVDVHHIFGVFRLEFGVYAEGGVWGGARLDPTEQCVETIATIGQ